MRPSDVGPGGGPGPRVCCAPFRALLGLALAAVLLAGTAPRAEAFRQWCRTDPVILVGGQVADVFVAIPLDAVPRVTGPTRFVITVPQGVEASLVLAGAGFGYGEEVEFRSSPALRVTATSLEVRVAAYVPVGGDATPVLVEFAPRVVGVLAPASAEGWANEWVHLRAGL